jgi:hypothetical protein
MKIDGAKIHLTLTILFSLLFIKNILLFFFNLRLFIK